MQAASAPSTSAESLASTSMRMSAMLGGTSPEAHPSMATRICSGQAASQSSPGSGIGGDAAERAALVPAVDGAPLVFVWLASAQEVELARALAHGLLDGVSQENGARA